MVGVGKAVWLLPRNGCGVSTDFTREECATGRNSGEIKDVYSGLVPCTLEIYCEGGSPT